MPTNIPHAVQPQPRQAGQLLALQYLRGIAAMMIVFCHAWDQLPWLQDRLPNVAQSGVDVFFVISGFIMVYVTARAGSSAAHFIRMRVIRIVPLYWVYNFGTAALILVLPELFKTSVFTLPHFLQSLFFIPHYGPSGSLSPLILLGWTLNYEMFFYVVFALAMALLAASRIPLSIAILVALPVLALFMNFEGNAMGEFYSNEIILEFILGMILASLFMGGALRRVGFAAGTTLIGLGAVGLAIGAVHIDDYPRALVFGVPAFLILTGALAMESSRGVYRVTPLLLLGDASYSIYLAHLFPIALLRFSWNRLDLPSQSLGPVMAFMGVALLGGALAGITSYFLLERPLLAFMNRRRHTAREASGLPQVLPAPQAPCQSTVVPG